jgi:tRNA dimethylallyltransferase
MPAEPDRTKIIRNSPKNVPRPPLVVILGPTASGKTGIAIQLAERLNGEIVSADSRSFYRGMDIGTAKPTKSEQTRAPHHLVDVAEPDEVWSLAVFQRAARLAIDEIHSRQRLPFLVGGTGQYIRAVIEGWQVPPAGPDRRLRTALEEWGEDIGPQGLHARLAVLDPKAAAQIDFRNLRRTVRALEVILRTGHRFSTQRRRGRSPYRSLLLGLIRPRPELYARIDARIEEMLEAGLVAEVQALLEKGYSPDLPTLSAIGYREVIDYLQGEISLEEAVLRMKRSTRQFVRRQANWFKESDPEIHWFRVGPNTVEEMEATIRTTFI